MSGKDFFLKRYAALGWIFKETRPRQAIRINRTRAKQHNLLERLATAGVETEKIPFLENGYRIKSSKTSAGATAEYLLGFYSIQEAAAQIPATLFSGIKSKLVWDACAAPGGKTVQLSDLMENSGVIIATDINKRRLFALSNHLERCHVANVAVYLSDAREFDSDRIFDRILLDVPCSGNFASDKAWFSRRTMNDVERNAKLQKAILARAVSCLAEDGEIVYSTCSLEPEENELNMDWAIKNLSVTIQGIDCIGEPGITNVFGQHLDKSIAKCKRIWPAETQGFFVCKLRRRSE